MNRHFLVSWPGQVGASVVVVYKEPRYRIDVMIHASHWLGIDWALIHAAPLSRSHGFLFDHLDPVL